MQENRHIKRLSILLLLLLTSFRLVASVAGVAVGGSEVGTAKKTVVTSHHDATQPEWTLSEESLAEENEEESHDDDDSFQFAALPALTSWFFASLLACLQTCAANALVVIFPPQPLFVLFQNFRI